MARDVAAAVLRVDKPEGPTSHDAVVAARRALDTRRVGHTGTLDPFASGLLLLCVGPATRLAQYFSGLHKTYIGVMRLGATTDTDDGTGRVIAESERWRELTPEGVEAALRTQVGELDQVPPAYSAKKVGGERMHRRARRGETVEAAPVRVTVDRITPLRVELPDVEFEVECSTGTYVRAIARDVGREAGAGAHLTALRRTRIGPHRVEDAVPMDRLDDPDAVAVARLSPLEALAHMPAVTIDEAAAQAVGHGQAVPAPAGAPRDEGPIVLVHRGELRAVAERAGDSLHPRKVFSNG